MALEMAAWSRRQADGARRKPGCVARVKIVMCETEQHADAAQGALCRCLHIAPDQIPPSRATLSGHWGASQSPTTAAQSHTYLAPPIFTRRAGQGHTAS